MNKSDQTGGTKLGEGGFGAVYGPRMPCGVGEDRDIINGQMSKRKEVEKITAKKAEKGVSKVQQRSATMKEEVAGLVNASKYLTSNLSKTDLKKYFIMAERVCAIPPEFVMNPEATAALYGAQQDTDWYYRKGGKGGMYINAIPNTSTRKQVIFGRGICDLDLAFKTIKTGAEAKDFMIGLDNLMYAVTKLSENRLLHGDIKLLNAVIAQDGLFKFIDLAGITSWKEGDIREGRFLFALPQSTSAGYYVTPLAAATIPLFLPRDQATRTLRGSIPSKLVKGIRDAVAKPDEPVTNLDVITSQYLKACNGQQYETQQLSRQIKRYIASKKLEKDSYEYTLASNIITNTDKQNQDAQSNFIRTYLRGKTYQEQLDYVIGRMDAYAMARILARCLPDLHKYFPAEFSSRLLSIILSMTELISPKIDMERAAKMYQALLAETFPDQRPPMERARPEALLKAIEKRGIKVPAPEANTASPGGDISLPPGLSAYRGDGPAAAGGAAAVAAAAAAAPVTGCSGKKKADCVGPDCIWVEGEKRKQCRRASAKKQKKSAVRKTQKKVSPKKVAVPAVLSAKSCAGKPKTACVGPNCKWVDGTKRKFCRRATNKKKEAAAAKK